MRTATPILVRVPRKRDGSIDHRRLRRVPDKGQRVIAEDDVGDAAADFTERRCVRHMGGGDA